MHEWTRGWGGERENGNTDVRKPGNENSENEWRGEAEEIQEIEEEKEMQML